MYSSGSCATGSSAMWPGPRAVIRIDLGADVPLGGSLTVTTCGNTKNNTVLFIGTGCPTWSGAFNCKAGNDNTGDNPGEVCADNPRASTVRITSTSERAYFVQLGGYGGTDVVAGLSWSFKPRLSSSSSASRTKRATASTSSSRTRKRKL